MDHERKEMEDLFSPSLVLTPVSRFPTRLAEATRQTVLETPLPFHPAQATPGGPRASIIVVTFNNLVFTKLCLGSLLANADCAACEIIVVDNASTDGTPEFLKDLANSDARVRLVLNDRNLGFAAANNRGLAIAASDRLVLLNNDTIVPPGSLARLLEHLQDATIGLVGPVTNRAGNEAQIPTTYQTYGEFLEFARGYPPTHCGETFEINVLTMFCLAFRREAYDRIGLLDERFGLGMFEDDDYSLRARAAGYRIVCAADVFVHHFGQASFGQLAGKGDYGELFHANRRRFERKWGRTWQPHSSRPDAEYALLVERVREVAARMLPPAAPVLVASKGDEALLDLGGSRASHFPQNSEGVYAGHNPADSADAIEQLEKLRGQGCRYLVFPRSAGWWLEFYAEFGQHLRNRYRPVPCPEDCCVIFDLACEEPSSVGTADALESYA